MHLEIIWIYLGFELPPGYQFLHCLVNSANGGDSSAVDGFAVADI